MVNDEHGSLLSLMEAAAYLQIMDLRDAVSDALHFRLSPSTALITWDVAERQDLTRLAAEAEETVARHFAAVSADEAWLSVPIDRVRLLLGLEKLTAREEEDVYAAAVAWLHAQSLQLDDERAAALLRLIRFPLLAKDFLRETVRNERRRIHVCQTVSSSAR